MDEATSALDSESEKLVQEALFNLMKNRTSIVIAHRLSTLREADLVLVLGQGRIAQIGTHAELLESPGHYREAARVQLSAGDGLLLGARG